MYETYTYNQLKDLPEEQKVEALKELKIIYPDNKDLAAHLNVIPMAISNMVGKYLEGKQLGRNKMTSEEKAQAKLQREIDKKLKEQQEEKLEKEKIVQQEIVNQELEVSVPQPVIPNAIVVPIINQKIKSNINTNAFSIKLDKNMTGEETILRLNGIANSLLKENEYRVELVIVEA